MISVLTVSEKGLVRKNNEDHVFASAEKGVFAVADGMGGGSEGERASEIVCEELARVASGDLAARQTAVDAAIVAANDRIRAYAHEKGFRQMGSTIAVILSDPDGAGRALVGHVGDSRVYRVRKGVAERLTEDHTIGTQLLAYAKGRQADELKSRVHPLAHVLTRVIGGEAKIVTTWRETELGAGDRFLVCSDGIHDVVSDEDVGRLIGEAKDLATAAQDLEAFVVRNGAPDNYSFVLGEVKS